MPEIPNDVIINAVAALGDLIEESATIINATESEPLPESVASQELRTYDRPTSLKTAYSQSYLVLENCADHALGFVDLFQGDLELFSIFSLARGVLESSAISIWIGRPDIEPLERVKRSFSFCFEGYRQQRTFAWENKLSTDPTLQALNRLLDQAAGQPIHVELNAEQKPKWIGMKYPALSDLVNSQLDRKSYY